MARRSILPYVFGAGLVLGIGALVLSSKKKASQTKEAPVTGALMPEYPTKYTAQALQLAALPDQRNPIMLCSYIPFASLEATDLQTAQALLARLKAEHETAPENLHGQRGRRQIVRLVKRYFDPKTFAELPYDVLFESDQKFKVPTSPDAGVPCG